MHTVASRGHNCSNTVTKHPTTLFEIKLLLGVRKAEILKNIDKKKDYIFV